MPSPSGPARFAVVAGALLAALAVALGAYGAHGLERRLAQDFAQPAADGVADDGGDRAAQGEIAKRLAWWDTAVRYHLTHAIALLIVGMLSAGRERAAWSFAVGAFALGSALFSGSLYIMTMAGPSWSRLGAVVPIGGLLLIVGWIAVAWGAWPADRGRGSGNLDRGP